MLRPDLETRLTAVLRDYQTLADSDPHQLRALIPPTEIWRLFVESKRQDNNYKLKNYLHMDRLEHGLGKTAMDQSLMRASSHPSIVTEDWPTLVDCLHLSTSDLESIKLRDLIAYNKGWFLFERSEPGYIKGLYRAFQCIYESHDSLSLDFILKVHQIATAGVANTNHRLFNYSKRGGKLRSTSGSRFSLCKDNADEKGIYEILHRWTSYSTFNVLDWEIDQYTPAKLRAGLPSNEAEDADEVKEEFPGFYQEVFSASNNRELAKALYRFLSMEDEPLDYHSTQTGNVHAQLLNDSTAVIDQYNLDIASAKTPMQKLSAIALAINILEDIHMFDDANCRSVCMITPNNLLFNCGLPLSLISDANRFDAKSHIKLIETLIEGMENTFRLIRTGALNGVRTFDLLALADKPNTIGATRKYFEEAVAIEQRARRRLRVAIPAGLKRAREEEDDDSTKKYARSGI